MPLQATRRTASALAVVVVLAVATAIAGWLIVRAVQSPRIERVTELAEDLAAVERVDASFGREVSALRGFLLTGREELREHAQEPHRQLIAASEELDRRATTAPVGAEVAQLHARYHLAMAPLLKTHGEQHRDIAPLQRRTQGEAAEKDFEEEVLPRQQDMSNPLSRWRAELHRQVQAARDDAARASRSARTVVVALIVVAVLALTALSTVLLRSAAREDEAQAQWEEFLASASHDLKTPLSSLRLNFQLLLRQQLAPHLTQRLTRMDKEVVRMSELIGYVLDVTRARSKAPVALRLEEVDLSAVVEAAAERMREQFEAAGGSLTIRTPGPVTGNCDRFRVEQVVQNLLSNALKYAAGAPVEVTVAAVDDKARLTVSDAGPGIAPEDRGQLFERFRRGKRRGAAEGHGLGLWITANTVQQHGGRILVDSVPGRGATFTVELPVEPRIGASWSVRPSPLTS